MRSLSGQFTVLRGDAPFIKARIPTRIYLLEDSPPNYRMFHQPMKKLFSVKPAAHGGDGVARADDGHGLGKSVRYCDQRPKRERNHAV
jgi:hypothetical protein